MLVTRVAVEREKQRDLRWMESRKRKEKKIMKTC